MSCKIKRKDLNNKIGILSVFLICFIPKFIIAISQVMLNTPSDEVSAISIAAFLSGYNWKDVISYAGYYGIGYLFIYAPLFKIGIAPITIYKAIHVVNAILIGLSGVICYEILKRYFEINLIWHKVVIASVCGCMSIFSTSISRTRNEDIYIVCNWLLAFFLLKLVYERNNRDKCERFILLVIDYSLTIHSRAVTLIIAIALVSICYYIIWNEKLLSLRFWKLMCITWGLIEIVLKFYQRTIWNTDHVINSSVANSTINALAKLPLDFIMIKSIIFIIGGQLFTAYSLSGGIFILSFIIYLLFTVKYMRTKKKWSVKIKQLILLGMLYGFCITITIIGQSVIWGVEVYKGLASNSYEYIYAYKAFTYMRYMGTYIPICTMVALVIAINEIDIYKKAVRYLLGSYILLFTFWINKILPYVKTTKSNMEFFVRIAALNKDIPNDVTVWYQMFFILFFITLVWQFHKGMNSFFIKLLLVGVVFTIFERFVIFYNIILPVEEYRYECIDEGIKMLDGLHDTLIDTNESVGVIDVRSEHQNWYLYQFMNSDLHIIPRGKDELLQDKLVISNIDISKDVSPIYKGFKLDENEFIYSKIEEYSKIIEENGYEKIT